MDATRFPGKISFALDIWYVDHWSLSLDFQSFAISVWKVIKREGISQPGFHQAEEFMGSKVPGEELSRK